MCGVVSERMRMHEVQRRGQRWLAVEEGAGQISVCVMLWLLVKGLQQRAEAGLELVFLQSS